MTEIQLKLSDGKVIRVSVDAKILGTSIFLKNMFELNDSVISAGEDLIEIENINSKTFELMVEYCELGNSSGAKDAFFRKVSDEELARLIKGANFLNIISLMEDGCKIVADMIKRGRNGKMASRF